MRGTDTPWFPGTYSNMKGTDTPWSPGTYCNMKGTDTHGFQVLTVI